MIGYACRCLNDCRDSNDRLPRDAVFSQVKALVFRRAVHPRLRGTHQSEGIDRTIRSADERKWMKNQQVGRYDAGRYHQRQGRTSRERDRR